MNTATVSEAATTPSWSTPVTSTTQSWPTSTGYEQYYNYYQTVPPPATTTAATTATPAYQQDYSQAWDEYYKAYYGQSYATTSTASQYPTNYSYDQYGYANFSAPPPNYYETTPQSSGYDYTQATPSVSSASFPSYNTAPTTTIPPTTNWSEPPPSFTQPSTYNNAQTYEQPQSFSQPPPISSAYETSMDQNNMPHPSLDQQTGSYGDPMQNKQKFNNNKMYETNPNSNYKPNQPALSNSAKETSYLEQFPPPSFGSPVKPMNRGRGASNFNNNRGRGQSSRGNSNFNAGRNQQFNRNNQYGNKSNNDRRTYGGNDYPEEGTSFANNAKSNFIGNKRGNRGNYNFNRGRNVENQGFQQRSKTDSWYQQDEVNEEGNNDADFDEADFYPNNEKKQDFGETSGFMEWNNEKTSQNQNYPLQNVDTQNQKRDFEPPKYQRNMDGAHNQKPGFDNQEFNSRMNSQNQQQRNGAFFNSNNPGNNRPVVRNMDRNPRTFQHPRQQFQRVQSNFSVNKPPMKLMDVVVQLSVQSPVIKRRQNMVDQWQRDIKELQNRRIPITYFWPIIKSALSAEIQDMLFVHCFPQVNGLICELILDDIFLVQARGEDEETAIESGSKALFDMFKSRVYVIASTRDADGEAVPGFCVSPSQQGPISLPPICRASAEVNANTVPFHPEPESETQVSIKPTPPKPAPVSQVTKSDSGLFLVLESSTNERDQSIASLVATSRFNNAVIDYQHEKLPHAPHISSCVITIDGVEIERHEARDYLVAKRQAADKVISKLKQTRPQIALRLDKAKVIKKEDLKKEDTFDKTITEFLQNYVTSFEDIPLKFDCDFTNEERNTIQTMLTNLNLGFKSEGKTTLFVFKQFPLMEMKNRLLSQGFCSQYQLIEKGSDCSSQ